MKAPTTIGRGLDCGKPLSPSKRSRTKELRKEVRNAVFQNKMKESLGLPCPALPNKPRRFLGQLIAAPEMMISEPMNDMKEVGDETKLHPIQSSE